MDILGLCIFGVFAVLVASFIGYFITTKKIIDSQETDIDILRRDNERLRADNQALIKQKQDLCNCIVRQQELKITKRLTPSELENLKKLFNDYNGRLDFPNSSKVGNNTRC